MPISQNIYKLGMVQVLSLYMLEVGQNGQYQEIDNDPARIPLDLFDIQSGLSNCELRQIKLQI